MATFAPYHVDIAGWTKWKSSSDYASFTRTINTNGWSMGYTACAAGGSSAKHIEWDVALAAGTWTIMFTYVKTSASGIATVSLDGSDIGTIDTWKSSGLQPNFRSSIASIVVASPGVKELKVSTATKNASSTDYDFLLQWITLSRTGA